MDRSEKMAETYLQTLSLGEVVFEPDGNVPPDFCVGGSIAVEVRRLNQNHLSKSGKAHGLEELDIPLSQKFRKYLKEFAPSKMGECWYVGYGFKRPLDWSVLKPLLTAALRDFYLSIERKPKKIQISRNFNIDFFRAGFDHGSFFVLGAYMDYDSGGWVMSELERNLRICVEEKEGKIEKYRLDYPVWWLVLIDYIDYGVGSEDRVRFRAEVMPRIKHSFDRIVLLNPHDPAKAFEI